MLTRDKLLLMEYRVKQGCQNRDQDRKIARFYDPTSPKRLKS